MGNCIECGKQIILPDPKGWNDFEFCSYTCFDSYQNELALQEQKESQCEAS